VVAAADVATNIIKQQKPFSFFLGARLVVVSKFIKVGNAHIELIIVKVDIGT